MKFLATYVTCFDFEEKSVLEKLFMIIPRGRSVQATRAEVSTGVVSCKLKSKTVILIA